MCYIISFFLNSIPSCFINTYLSDLAFHESLPLYFDDVHVKMMSSRPRLSLGIDSRSNHNAKRDFLRQGVVPAGVAHQSNNEEGQPDSLYRNQHHNKISPDVSRQQQRRAFISGPSHKSRTSTQRLLKLSQIDIQTIHHPP